MPVASLLVYIDLSVHHRRSRQHFCAAENLWPRAKQSCSAALPCAFGEGGEKKKDKKDRKKRSRGLSL